MIADMKTIVQVGDPVLRKKAQDVPLQEIPTATIQSLLADMRETLAAETDGVGLAAPQIGVPLRVFIVSKKAFERSKKEQARDLVCINPRIIKTSRKKDRMDEGCLSVRGKYGNVSRALKVTIEAYDEVGTSFEYGASGLLAQIFQHEIDHLNGTLFIDKADDVHNVDHE